MQNQESVQKENVRYLLKKAFPNAFRRKPRIKHNNLVNMRKDIALFTSEDLHWILPLILEDLLDTHTNDQVSTDGLEFVLMTLNKTNYVSEATERQYVEMWGSEFLEHERAARAFVQKASDNDFVLFTQNQSQAVYEWLCLASRWEDTKMWQDDLIGAMEYWKQRSNI